jgi:hypothetical protein
LMISALELYSVMRLKIIFIIFNIYGFSVFISGKQGGTLLKL